MKQLLKNILLPALASRPVSALAQQVFTPGIPVFMLHRFNDAANGVKGHDPQFLDKCLTYLKQQHYHFVSIEQIANALISKTKLPTRSIAFTMDDGFLDQATIAAPIFIKHDCPATIFLISGMLDNELWPWDDQISYLVKNTQQQAFQLKIDAIQENYSLQDETARRQAMQHIQNWFKSLDATAMPDYLNKLAAATAMAIPERPPENYQAMNWDMARKLEQQGIYFAAHTRSHRILSQLDDEQSHKEINHSCSRLAQELANPSPVFCYPTGRSGDFSNREIGTLRESGQIAAVSTQPTFIQPSKATGDYIYQLPRFALPDNFSDFIQYSSWIERAKTQLLRR